MARSTFLSSSCVAILLVIFQVHGFELFNLKRCSEQKSNITFGQQKSQDNDTFVLRFPLFEGGFWPYNRTVSKFHWPPNNNLKLAKLKPTFINVVDKGKLCDCNNTVRLNPATGLLRNFTSLEVFSEMGCPINMLIELWAKNETTHNSKSNKP